MPMLYRNCKILNIAVKCLARGVSHYQRSERAKASGTDGPGRKGGVERWGQQMHLHLQHAGGARRVLRQESLGRAMRQAGG